MTLARFTTSVRRAASFSTLILLSAIILSACSAQGNTDADNSENVSDGEASVTSGDVSESGIPVVTETLDEAFEDYSAQINADSTGYELDGRVSDIPIVIGRHEHIGCEDSDSELMALGQERLDAAVKLYKVIHGLAPVDLSKFIFDEYGNEIYAIDGEFGTYDSIMELCRSTFAPEVGEWNAYYSVERPEELLNSGFAGLEVDGEYISPKPISEILDRSMSVEDGITYESVSGGYDNHRLATKIIGVMNRSDTYIEYRLCTMVLDESAGALAVSEEIPQVFYEHSVMKIELIDGEWLITQLRDDLGNERDSNETFIAKNGLEF